MLFSTSGNSLRNVEEGLDVNSLICIGLKGSSLDVVSRKLSVRGLLWVDSVVMGLEGNENLSIKFGN